MDKRKKKFEEKYMNTYDRLCTYNDNLYSPVRETSSKYEKE